MNKDEKDDLIFLAIIASVTFAFFGACALFINYVESLH
jgi:hypothetical protein